MAGAPPDSEKSGIFSVCPRQVTTRKPFAHSRMRDRVWIVRRNGSQPRELPGLVRTSTRQYPSECFHGFWDRKRPVSGSKRKRPQAGYSGPALRGRRWEGTHRLGMLSIEIRLAVSEKVVQYYFVDYLEGAWAPDVRGFEGPKNKGPELGNSRPALRGRRWEGTHRLGCCLLI